ncbi:hypothetical protein AALO_G00047820 [Alosa alosa]|uniref:G protein-coupled receptor 160 n=1 Tax=Alosa alosa TaxID=278164 RepID=A0AAV6H3T0_9TELE|nr:uncharacterized protein si:dkeyp-100a1.6 [Alosa alosa]XP_048097774.1 uncharacterized protein si:dkeyp-100a1.6 [Alosa alosa]XP_048097775.1 uncharacterized protein si:dkeyp-100a1.6 [Alosa alosa]KAG5281699.1 hypothetical protein AALO_G00047820 [Alosa alosa]
MLLDNHSILAVLQERADWDAHWEEHTPDFLSLLLIKVLLNCVLLACGYGSQRPTRSLMGLCFLSLCLADFLLATTLAVTRLQGDPQGYPGYQALILAHASAVYALLPLPVLALGSLDYAYADRRGAHQLGGSVGQGGAVLVLWVLAGLYSAGHTDPSVLEVKLRPPQLVGWARVCEVRVAWEVSLFCLVLLMVVGVVLLLHLPHVPRWTRLIHCLTVEREAVGMARSNLAVTHSKTPLTQADVPVSNSKMPLTHADLPIWSVEMEGQPPCQRGPPLYVTCVLLFAVPWCPYLLLHLSSQLLQLSVPSYVSVNTLWLSCANSLLAGITSWARARQDTGTSTHHLDAVCDWRIPSYVSYRGNSPGPLHKVPLELQTPSERKLKPLLLL